MDFFKDLADIRNSFRRFAQNTKPDGVIILSSAIADREEIVGGIPAAVVTFGLSETDDYYPCDIRYDARGCATFTVMHTGQPLGEIQLCVPGAHNVTNALAAIACADHAGISFADIREGLFSFHGTDRRFQYKGERNGVTVIDDYAHHPTEIRATLSAAANYPHDRLIVVFQPHTYSRTKAFLPDFADALQSADLIVLADIYAAREKNTYGVSADDIRVLLTEKGCNAVYLPTFDEITKFLQKNCVNGDLLITMGAGNVVEIGETFLAN